jgi:tRNA(Ile)-lysidine synthase
VNNGVLLAEETVGLGFSKKLVDKVQIRFRQGGETFIMSGRPRKSLKKIFQEARIEPWLRPRIPLIYCKDELICVVGIGISEKALANNAETGFTLTWCFPQD